MNNRSAALFRASNVQIMDYCLPASVASALQVCDEAVIVADENSQDDTLALAYKLRSEYGKGQVTVLERTWEWDRMWQEKVWNWGMEATDADWLMYHDADEALHENDVGHIRDLMKNSEMSLIGFHYIHLYGTPRFRASAFYPYNTRLGRRSAGYRMRNWCSDETPNRSVCEMVWTEDEIDSHHYRGPEFAWAGGPMYHYGWCRDALVLGNAHARASDWYADGKQYANALPTDKQPLQFNLGERLRDGKIERFGGTRPAVMAEWFAKHEIRWANLEVGL